MYTVTLSRKLTADEIDWLDTFSSARHTVRDMDKVAAVEGITTEEAVKLYGEQGEFYYRFPEFDYRVSPTVLDRNTCPGKMPSLFCPIFPCIEDEIDDELDVRMENSNDCFYDAALWLQWLIDNWLLPKGIIVKDESIVILSEIGVENSYELVISDNQVYAYPIILVFDESRNLLEE